MKPFLFPADYKSSDFLEKEINLIFKSTWIFATYTDYLEKDNDFVTFSIGEISIAIQNFNGKIKAFKNVCTHRFSLIQLEENGNRPLMCPYHGWTFNEEGAPVGIPKKPHFGELTKEDVDKLCLEQWEVGVVGRFIFIKLKKNNESLDDFLGSFKKVLQQFSEGMGILIDKNTLDLNCNWKVAVENTLESYHVPLVHPKTFFRLGASGETFEFEHKHSSWRPLVNEKSEKQWKLVEKYFQSRPVKISGYNHHFVFPNMTLATTFGNSFSIQSFLPITPSQTRFTSTVFATKNESDRSVVTTIQKTFNSAITEFNRKVFLEDKQICDQVQKGVEIAINDGLLSDIETRVYFFQKNVTEMINERD